MEEKEKEDLNSLEQYRYKEPLDCETKFARDVTLLTLIKNNYLQPGTVVQLQSSPMYINQRVETGIITGNGEIQTTTGKRYKTPTSWVREIDYGRRKKTGWLKVRIPQQNTNLAAIKRKYLQDHFLLEQMRHEKDIATSMLSSPPLSSFIKKES